LEAGPVAFQGFDETGANPIDITLTFNNTRGELKIVNNYVWLRIHPQVHSLYAEPRFHVLLNRVLRTGQGYPLCNQILVSASPAPNRRL